MYTLFILAMLLEEAKKPHPPTRAQPPITRISVDNKTAAAVLHSGAGSSLVDPRVGGGRVHIDFLLRFWESPSRFFIPSNSKKVAN